jgi:hypothetical protein
MSNERTLFKPGRSRRIFQGEKILSTPSFGGEVKPLVPCRRFAACKRTLRFTWKSESQAKLSGHFSPYIRSSLTEVGHGVPLEMTDGTNWRCTKGPYLRSRCIRGGIPETATSIYNERTFDNQLDLLYAVHISIELSRFEKCHLTACCRQ